MGQLDSRWVFPATRWRVYDADTIMDCQVALGFGITFTLTGRLRGINAPEVRGPEKIAGRASRDWLKNRLREAAQVQIETHQHRQGKFGRWIITVWADGENVNEELVARNLAQRASY